MTKYMRTRHVPLNVAEPKVVQEEFDDLLLGSQQTGGLLQALREGKKWSQRELGERVGLDEHYILLMEKGERPITPSFAKLFGDVFDTDYKTLL